MEKILDIIIPVHDRKTHTEQTIRSLYNSATPDLFRLVVVNDKSDQDTTLLLTQLKKEFDFYLIANEENIGPGASRNLACNVITNELGRSNFLYHSDNDVYFTKGWIYTMDGAMKLIDVSGIKVLGGSCHPYLQNKEVREYWAMQYSYKVGIKDAVSGYSQMMTWETWDNFGPFDETMRNAEKKIMGSEDWAFCQKIIKAGFLVGSIEPEVVIPCGKTNTYGELATGHETFKQVEGVTVL